MAKAENTKQEPPKVLTAIIFLLILGVIVFVAVKTVTNTSPAPQQTNPFDYSGVTNCQVLKDSELGLIARLDQTEAKARDGETERDRQAAAREVTSIRLDLTATQKRINELGCK